MKRISNPCYDCEDRKVVNGYNCHTECPQYAEYKCKLEKKRQANYQRQAQKVDYRTYRQAKEKRLVR